MATSLELAITAIRSGRKEEGRQLLNLLIQQNPNNEMAWLWMSSVVDTDEQRARCLYHVLAINPKNELARRGLQLLGIVVSDSRPVRIPRDSQPIPIQKPQPEVSLPDSLLNPASLPAQSPQPQPPTQPVPLPPAAPVPAGQPAPDVERRPFRLDPRTITQELPFIPLREPFAETARRSPSAFTPRADITPPSDGQPPAGGSEPVPVVSPAPQPGQTGSLPQPAESIPAWPGAAADRGNAAGPPAPSEAVPAAPNGNSAPPAAGLPQPEQAEPKTVADTGPLSNPAPSGEQNGAPPPGQTPPVPTASPQMPANGGTMSHQETRPSPPIWATQTNAPIGLPQPAPANPATFPPAPSFNSNVTMGMPTPYLQPQLSPQILPGFHSNATMGMPMPNGQPFPAEAMAMLHSNATMSMPTYAPAYPTPFPQNPVYHSSPTMSMPTMTEAEARARLLAGQGIAPPLDPIAALRAAAASAELNAHRSRNAKRGAGDDEDEAEEDVNLLAVIVFGSLSVTALGGLGMLILLWFTSV